MSGAAAPFRFYLGAHHPSWLAKTAAPLFISRARLASLAYVLVWRAELQEQLGLPGGEL